MRKEDGDGLFWGAPGEDTIDVVAPELETESADLRCGDCVCDAGYFDIECANGEVGCLGGRRDEWEEGV